MFDPSGVVYALCFRSTWWGNGYCLVTRLSKHF